jgi:hypothetical protein
MNLWRLAFAVLLAALGGFAVGAGATYIVQKRPPAGELAVVAPVQVGMTPIRVGPRGRIVASVRRFAKIFVFVALGLLAASLASPEGFRLIVEPLNVVTMVVASTVGALLKWFQWSDVTAEVPPTITLSLAPTTPAAVLAAPVKGVTP